MKILSKSIARVIATIAGVLLVASGIGLINTVSRLEVLDTLQIDTGEQNTSLHRSADTLFIGTGQNNVLAYDVNGERLWQFSAKGLIRKVAVRDTDGLVLAGSEDRNIYIIDPVSGDALQTLPIRGKLFDMDSNRINGQLAVSSGVSAVKHYISLYDMDGNRLWEKDIGISSFAIAFIGSRIVYGTNRGEVFLVDSSGREIKKMKLDGQIMDFSSNDYEVACLTERGSLYFFNADLVQTGGLLASGEARAVDVFWEENLALVGMESGSLHLIERSGKVRDVMELPLAISEIYVDRNDIKVTCRDGFLYTLDKSALESIAENKTRLFGLIAAAILCIAVLIWTALILVPGLRRGFVSFGNALYEHRTAYLMLLPIFLLLIVFHYIPVAVAMVRSFTNWSVHSEKIQFNGLDNFRLMINEGYFLAGLKNLGILTGTGFLKLFTMPLLAAKLVYHMRGRKKAVFRLLFVLPMVVPGVVGALMWQNIYDPNIGLLNNLLEVVGLESLQRVWLGSEKTAIWSIVFMGFPFIEAFAFLVYYGGLINISDELFEASNLAGANGWWNFWKIQLPLLTPQIKMLIILTFIGAIQNFAPILILTGGGPGISTYVPGLELYYNITRFGRYGYASALGLVMFVFIFGGTLLNLRMKTTSENEI